MTVPAVGITEPVQLALLALAGTIATATITGVFGVLVVRAQRRIERDTQQLRPNGGASMHDQLALVSARLDAGTTEFVALNARLGSVEQLQLDHGRALGHALETVHTLGAALAEVDGKVGVLGEQVTSVALDLAGHRAYHEQHAKEGT